MQSCYDEHVDLTKLGFPSISIVDDGAPADQTDERTQVPLRQGGDGVQPEGGSNHTKVMIIGSGPAGLTAAIYAARANLEPIVVGGYAPGGQLMITSDVENFPGFPEGIQGPELMQKFREQAERFGTRFVDVDADKVDFSTRPFHIWAEKVEYTADSVIVATGASALWLGLDNETRLRGRGVSRLRHVRRLLLPRQEGRRRGRRRHGPRGGHVPDPLRDGGGAAPPPRPVPGQQDHAGARPRTTPRSACAGTRRSPTCWARTRSSGLRLRDTADGEESDEPMEGLFVAIGYKPNTDVFRDWLEVDDKGYLVVTDETHTKVEGVFIAGDVHDHRYRQAITAAADGCKAAIDAERWLEAQGIAEAATATAW